MPAAELQHRYPACDWAAHLRAQGMQAPDSKAAMDTLVENLRAALRQNIAGID